MANLKISELPEAGKLQETDLIPIVQQTSNSKITNKVSMKQFINYIETGTLADFKAKCDKAYASKSHTHDASEISGISDILSGIDLSSISCLVQRMSTVEDLLSGTSNWWYIDDCEDRRYYNITAFLSTVRDSICCLRSEMSYIYSCCSCSSSRRTL